MGKNVKHAGEEQAVRGHDIVVGKHFEGGRRRAMSNTNTGTRSSSAATNVRDTLVKRKSIQERQSDVMERHLHWSFSGVAGSEAQRAGAREAAPRYHRAGTQGHDIDVDVHFEGDRNRMQVQDGGGERDDDGDTDGDAEAGADADQDRAAAAEGGQEQEGARPEIQARLRRAPEVIVTETWANRAQRTRQPRELFQAGTKKPGTGRKDW